MKISINLPVGSDLNEGYSDSWQFLPTLLLNIPLKDDVIEFNLSPKILIPLTSKGGDNLAADNLGFGFSKDLKNGV